MHQLQAELTPRQQAILEFIGDFIHRNHYPPSVRDIVKGSRISSTSVAAYNIRALEAKGLLRRQPDISRGLELVKSNQNEGTEVPLMGYIAAGKPVPVPSEDSWSYHLSADTVTVPSFMIKGRKSVYALAVKGDSMQDALIADGDTIVIQALNQVENGETAAVWLKNERETTLKKVYYEHGRVRLQPANQAYKPIYTSEDNALIQGKLIGVLRSYSEI